MSSVGLNILTVVTAVAVVCGCGRKSAEQKKMEAAAKQMSEMAEKVAQEGQPSQADMAKTVEAMQKAMANQSKVEPVDFRELKALLPESLKGMKRGDASGEKSGAMGMSISKAEASYDSDSGASVDIEITDMGGINNFAAAAQFGWAMQEIDRETKTGYEKTMTIAGYKGYEEYDRENKSGKVQVMVKGRFMVEARGSSVDMDAIQAAIKAVDLNKLAGLAK
jgi:hypothetical protein